MREDDRLRKAIHAPSFRDGALAPDLRCAIAHRGISRFRVRCFASPRNDGYPVIGRRFTPTRWLAITEIRDDCPPKFRAHNLPDTPKRPATRFRPRFCLFVPPSHSEGAGNAGRRSTRSRACSVVSTRVSHHEYTRKTPGIPRAMVLTPVACSPRRPAFLPPSPAKLSLANLMPAPGHQDHTPWPSAALAPVKRAARVHRIPPQRP